MSNTPKDSPYEVGLHIYFFLFGVCVHGVPIRGY